MDRLHGMGDMFFSEPFMEPPPFDLVRALKTDSCSAPWSVPCLEFRCRRCRRLINS